MTTRIDSEAVVLDLAGTQFEERMSTAERLNVLAALACFDSDAVQQRLREVAGLESVDAEVRYAAIEVLAERHDGFAGEWLERSLTDHDPGCDDARSR